MDYLLEFKKISDLIAARGLEQHFSLHDALSQHDLNHISYSQIKSIEFCPINYHFQYVQKLEMVPTPAYFVKGKVFHEVLANNYARLRETPDLEDVDVQFDGSGFNSEHYQHIENAISLHLNNLWNGFEILGIEDSFALNISNNIPPVVGVIDLLLRDASGTIYIIDHKTGHYFNEQDAFQMAVYHQYIQREYKPTKVEYYYDHYRWVNNLSRIRKPAFKRERIDLPHGHEKQTTLRITQAAERIEDVRAHKTIDRRWYADRGECFRCPFKIQCYG